MWGRQSVGPFRPLRSAHVDSGRVLLRAIPPPAPILPAGGSSAPHFLTAEFSHSLGRRRADPHRDSDGPIVPSAATKNLSPFRL